MPGAGAGLGSTQTPLSSAGEEGEEVGTLGRRRRVRSRREAELEESSVPWVSSDGGRSSLGAYTKRLEAQVLEQKASAASLIQRA